MTNASDTNKVSKPRRRGRPRQDETGGDELRETVIQAAADIYASKGYHGTTVALILKAANVSRPTFYKLFNDRRDVIEIVVERANRRLFECVIESIGDIEQPSSMLKAAIEAYFRWCEEIGPLAGPIYAEINDIASPAAFQRSHIIADLVAVFAEQESRLGLTNADPLLYDALLRAVEHLGSSAFWPDRLPKVEIARRRKVAIQMALRVVQNNTVSEVKS